MPLHWLALALLAAADGDGPRFEGSVTAGGGYDAILLAAPGTASEGSSVATLTATGGVAVELSESVILYAGAVLDGAKFPTLPELDRAGAGAEATLLLDLVGPLSLALCPSASYAWYNDPGRTGATVAGRLSLRYRPLRWLALRAGYAHVLKTATDPVFGSNVDRLFAEVEFRLGHATWLSLGGFGDWGDGTFFAEVPAADGSGVAALAPYRAPSTTAGASLGLEQGLGAGFSIDLVASMRRTKGPDGAVVGPSFGAAVAWRWD